MLENIILTTKALGNFSDDEFYNFCLENPDLKFERTSKGQIIIMPNTGGNTGRINSAIIFQLYGWNLKMELGEVFDSSTAFRLPNTAVRSPDASWITKNRWESLTEKQQKQFPPLCPDFVIELRSETDSWADLDKKIQEEWLVNGCRLAWLIDPLEQKAYIYRPEQTVEEVSSFDHILKGEHVLPAFELNLESLK
ncbi:MAG: Uma2 family endonuclease [Microscillaceae bacterium]|nr:Uma2 family endonuclease [Microscillaceae bacterium]